MAAAAKKHGDSTQISIIRMKLEERDRQKKKSPIIKSLENERPTAVEPYNREKEMQLVDKTDRKSLKSREKTIVFPMKHFHFAPSDRRCIGQHTHLFGSDDDDDDVERKRIGIKSRQHTAAAADRTTK